MHIKVRHEHFHGALSAASDTIYLQEAFDPVFRPYRLIMALFMLLFTYLTRSRSGPLRVGAAEPETVVKKMRLPLSFSRSGVRRRGRAEDAQVLSVRRHRQHGVSDGVQRRG